jgi:hypothetical protein
MTTRQVSSMDDRLQLIGPDVL